MDHPVDSSTASPHWDLQRFVDAQNPQLDTVIQELTTGHKRSHWMWHFFPQIAGLGQSATSQHYALASLDEARAYLEHTILGGRLRQLTGLVNELPGHDAQAVFGPVDALKFRSSMTLFHLAAGDCDSLFQDALDKYFGGQPDRRTLDLAGLPRNLPV
ncbi:uncharacterized protein (DUF1810 family) [Nitrospirillum amazonense]|uniref:Uncharacterized protein (DUF1810 family) n=1 Tax=Nitrospirillum amazonense TaxID=28077 RepID=A0A560FSS5_9PROT|nr:DUF1810 domain-containing protein [Nitrospirillum amazonense]TWB24611.1 uncharacterized protein (DUF1810 family) [Nitrospirillum amazonense]